MMRECSCIVQGGVLSYMAVMRIIRMQDACNKRYNKSRKEKTIFWIGKGITYIFIKHIDEKQFRNN